jgi:AcrR family transcriptional regulator
VTDPADFPARRRANRKNGAVPDKTDIPRTRTRNRWGEGDRLRLEILDAASTVLSELGGEDGLTIRGVARAVGIAPASIYQHFTDRAALVSGLLEHEFTRLRTQMGAADEDTDPADVTGRVRAQLHAYCAYALANPGIYRLMLSKGSHRPTPGARPVGPLMDVLDQLAEGFARCAEAGHTLRLPPDRAATVVFVSTHGRVALSQGTGTPGAARLHTFVDEVFALVLA